MRTPMSMRRSIFALRWFIDCQLCASAVEGRKAAIVAAATRAVAIFISDSCVCDARMRRQEGYA